jgi:tetratricopeptide (TPR) repeat protein
MFACQIDSMRSNLQELDAVLKHKNIYEQAKIMRIDSLKIVLQRSDIQSDKKYDLYVKLYEEYQMYNYEQAYFYTEKMLDLATAMNDKNKIIMAQLSMAYCCLNAGLFKESTEIAQKIDIKQLSVHHKMAVYSFLSKLNLDMSNSIMVEPYQSAYSRESIRYSQLVIDLLGEDNPQSLPHKVNIYRCQCQYQQAVESIQLQLEIMDLNKRSKSLNIGGMGLFYLLLKDTAQAIPYLCYAAIADIRAVIKETPALCMLASIVYDKGDLQHAYQYATEALADAEFYNARHRKIEVGNVLPIIEKTRFDIINKQRRWLVDFSIIISVLLVLFLVAAVIILRQMKQLRQAREINKKQNETLKQINDKLKEVDNIKNGYIGYFFSVNSAFIEKLEYYRKLITQKLMGKQYDDLLRILRTMEIQKYREELFNSFDQIFIKIFPDFVTQFNSLLKEEHRVTLKFPHMLTPEIRIFALIRLGVSDVESIAKFLNYSVHTINTYKSKVKKHALVPSEHFEQEIMKIELIC